ncbi:hypothetical protein PMAYCL1PPCAC_00963, partial [Pristionchus mayeri]
LHPVVGMRRILLVSFLALALVSLGQSREGLPAHLSSFVARLRTEIEETAAKFDDPRERATRILATHIGLLSQLPIAERKLLTAYYEGNSLLEAVDPHNYRREVMHKTSPHP